MHGALGYDVEERNGDLSEMEILALRLEADSAVQILIVEEPRLLVAIA
jgi:hypothetical protein